MYIFIGGHPADGGLVHAHRLGHVPEDHRLEEIDAFLADTSEGAYERLVDRLLQSPRYGQRMALAWMDAARYGDTSVMHADGPRTMWPWRDWAIRAYNGNMPFDRFTVDQIAGRDAALVGEITAGQPSVVIETALGGERFLEELEDDPLPRIC